MRAVMLADDELTLFSEECILEAKEPQEESPRQNQNCKFIQSFICAIFIFINGNPTLIYRVLLSI